MEVLVRSLRGLTLPLAAALVAFAVHAGDDALARFLRDRSVRRAALERSLAGRPLPGAADPAYAIARLAHYAVEGDASWEALPEWNPPACAAADRAACAPLSISDAARAGDRDALRALGRAAFTQYPAQRAAFDADALSSEHRTALGLWTDPATGQLGGLVRVQYPDGVARTALTCATCHARVRAGALELGAPNDALDLGALMLDAPLGRSGPPRAFAAWGPGRVDVTTRSGAEPAHIADLRPVRFQKRLQHAGLVQQHDTLSLAVRIETLLVGAYDAAVRPPREVALGLALFLESLAVPPLTPAPAAFARACAHCHLGDGLSGELVPVDVVGTDATLARSRERGTGAYRVPSLRGVGTRTRLLHDGSVRSVDALLDPARTGGHAFGRGLTRDERAAIVAWLAAL